MFRISIGKSFSNCKDMMNVYFVVFLGSAEQITYDEMLIRSYKNQIVVTWGVRFVHTNIPQLFFGIF